MYRCPFKRQTNTTADSTSVTLCYWKTIALFSFCSELTVKIYSVLHFELVLNIQPILAYNTISCAGTTTRRGSSPLNQPFLFCAASRQSVFGVGSGLFGLHRISSLWCPTRRFRVSVQCRLSSWRDPSPSSVRGRAIETVFVTPIMLGSATLDR